MGEALILMDIYIFHSCQLAKQAILPRVHGLALKTTVAAVCIFTYLFILYFFLCLCILLGCSCIFILDRKRYVLSIIYHILSRL
jgi:hypothetical protein